MITFWRVAAYTFLAMSGMYAWLSIETGWRHYLGLAIFFLASVRIMILIFPKKSARKNAAEKEKAEPGLPDASQPQDKNSLS
jgi:cytochrome b